MRKEITFECRAASMLLMVVFLAGAAFKAHADEDESKFISTEKLIFTYTVNQDGSYTREVERTLLVETDMAVDYAGQEKITYSPMYEKVKILEAYTIQPDGSHVNVPEESVRTVNDSIERGGSVYSDRKHKVIIYPKVAAGTLTHCKYTVTRHKPIFSGYFSVRHFMSPHLKVRHYEVNFNLDKRIHVKVDSQGYEGGALPDKDGFKRYHFTSKNDVATPYEPNEVSSSDFSPYVEATTFENYEALGKAYQGKAKAKVVVTPAIKNLANELTLGVEDKAQQARILYNWVSKNIRYIGLYIGNGGYIPHDTQTILNNRWGDCKDHVVILEALLAAKGIASSPALIAAGNSYVLPKSAGLTTFNHVITYIPSLDLYLDSTAQFAPFGVLPEGDLNKDVVLTAFNKMGKTPAMLAKDNVYTTPIKLKVLPDGRIQGSSLNAATGVGEISARARNFGIEIYSKKELVRKMLAERNLTGTGTVAMSDPANLDQPFEISATFTLDPIANLPGAGAIRIPGGIAPNVMHSSSFAKPLDKQNYPSSCHSKSFVEHYEIEFPDNIKIAHIPSDVKYADRATRYNATYRLNGRKLDIKRDLIYQYPSMVCGNAENEEDKALFKVMQRDLRAQVLYE